MAKWWYVKIQLDDFYKGRKVWYMNDSYICDCKNSGFKTREEAEESIGDIKRKFGGRIKSLSIHWSS